MASVSKVVTTTESSTVTSDRIKNVSAQPKAVVDIKGVKGNIKPLATIVASSIPATKATVLVSSNRSTFVG